MLRRAVALGLFTLALAAGVFTLELVRDDPGYGLAGTSTLDAVALLAPGWALVACGVAWWVGREEGRFGVLLALAGLAWFVAEWDNPGIESSLAFTAGLSLFAACPALVGHAALVHPGGRLGSTVERGVVAFAYGSVLVAGVLPALFFDPRTDACSACPANLLAVTHREALSRDLARVGLALALAATVALVSLLARRLARRAARPVAAPAAAYLALVAALLAVSLGDAYVSGGTVEHRLWLCQALALLALAAGVAWGWARARRARAEMARLVVALSRSPPPGGLCDVLAGIVHDPDLVLAYPLETGRLVDARGLEVELPAGREQTNLVHSGRAVAVLAHAPGVLDDEQLMGEVTDAARLALEHERLQAEVRARLEDLRASRSRIVATGDAERRRLERDLHDGAQQRLVALSLSLRLARLGALDTVELERAERELTAAIEALRALAHGIFPAVLADDGLEAAVRALAEEAHVPLQIGDFPDERFAQALETAAYTLVAETVRTSHGAVSVSARRVEGVLELEVGTAGVGDLDVVAIEDRLGALDGRVEVVRGVGGTMTLRAELPCES